jgi:hypothetical protein
MKLNKSGDRRGCHGNQRKGPKHGNSVGWIIYKHEEFHAEAATLAEAGEIIGHSAHYVWQMVNGKTGYWKKRTQHGPHTDLNGFSVVKKPKP